MRIIRPLLFLLLIAGIAGGGYLFWTKKRAASSPAMSSSMSSSSEGSDQNGGFQIGGFHLPSFKGDTMHVTKPDLTQVSKQAQTQLEQLKDKSLEVKEHVGTVLGEAQEATGEGTLQQRALEYGQYLYCKGVVEEWEKTNAK